MAATLPATGEIIDICLTFVNTMAQDRFDWAVQLQDAAHVSGLWPDGLSINKAAQAIGPRLGYSSRQVTRWLKEEVDPPDPNERVRILATLSPRPIGLLPLSQEARTWGLFVIGQVEAQLNTLRNQLNGAPTAGVSEEDALAAWDLAKSVNAPGERRPRRTGKPR